MTKDFTAVVGKRLNTLVINGRPLLVSEVTLPPCGAVPRMQHHVLKGMLHVVKIPPSDIQKPILESVAKR